MNFPFKAYCITLNSRDSGLILVHWKNIPYIITICMEIHWFLTVVITYVSFYYRIRKFFLIRRALEVIIGKSNYTNTLNCLPVWIKMFVFFWLKWVHILSVPKFTANLYWICISIPEIYTYTEAVQIAVNFGTLSMSLKHVTSNRGYQLQKKKRIQPIVIIESKSGVIKFTLSLYYISYFDKLF